MRASTAIALGKSTRDFDCSGDQMGASVRKPCAHGQDYHPGASRTHHLLDQHVFSLTALPTLPIRRRLCPHALRLSPLKKSKRDTSGSENQTAPAPPVPLFSGAGYLANTFATEFCEKVFFWISEESYLSIALQYTYFCNGFVLALACHGYRSPCGRSK